MNFTVEFPLCPRGFLSQCVDGNTNAAQPPNLSSSALDARNEVSFKRENPRLFLPHNQTCNHIRFDAAVVD